ncbi:MAG: type IV pilus twitching motility protein PilT [Candidatus Omnitrophota bacterium]
MKKDLDSLLRMLVERNGSDLHLQANTPPIFRIYGELKPTEMDVLSAADIEEFVFSVMDKEQKDLFLKVKHIDLSYEIKDVGRFRVNVFRQKGCVGSVMRAIPIKIATIAELSLPPIVKDFAALPNGLILVTGPTGSGKTTTLAAIIDYINTNRRGHILTVEDPIEFIHSNKLCEVNQRELHLDTDSFSDALRDALREDPNIILVGEMRDLETVALAITAAETGHLVFATLHTNNAPQTVDRIIDVFPPYQQPQIRTQLASTLKGVIAQTLLRRTDGTGRVAAFEIMVGNAPIRALINDGKSNQLYNTIQLGRNDGMQTMDSYLMDLVQKGVVTAEEASSKAYDRSIFKLQLKSKA